MSDALADALRQIRDAKPFFHYVKVGSGGVNMDAPGSPYDRGRDEAFKELQAIALAALAAHDAAPRDAQCCMCGKKGLSTAEDGGPECELTDGRWTCSRECYDRATDAPRDAGSEYRLSDKMQKISDTVRSSAQWDMEKDRMKSTAPAWVPPENRADGYECLGWSDDEWVILTWRSDPAIWCDEYGRHSPTAFAPLPDTPKDTP